MHIDVYWCTNWATVVCSLQIIMCQQNMTVSRVVSQVSRSHASSPDNSNAAFYLFTLSVWVLLYTGCFYKLLPINLVWGPFKYSKSNFNPVHVFLHFKSFCLVVLKVIFASKLSELQQFENWAANYQGWKWGKLLRVEIRQKKLTNAINKI